MKPYYTILLMSLMFGAFGQKKPKGTFCTPPGFVGYCLTFKNDSVFEYSFWSCINQIRAKGIYRINEGELILGISN